MELEPERSSAASATTYTTKTTASFVSPFEQPSRDLFWFINRGRFEMEGINAQHARASDEAVLVRAWGVILWMDEEFACFRVSSTV
jgi:hypothetical protein